MSDTIVRKIKSRCVHMCWLCNEIIGIGSCFTEGQYSKWVGGFKYYHEKCIEPHKINEFIENNSTFWELEFI